MLNQLGINNMAKLKQKTEGMSAEEAKTFRASLYRPTKTALTVAQKREQFRIFWAKSRKKYKTKIENIEQILWLHMLASDHDEPSKFSEGLRHFGLKQIGKGV
jgi:hypothetical protein